MPDGLTLEEVTEAWRLFREHRCEHCGASHSRACPRVKRMEWHTNGTIAAVEFWPEGSWPQAGLTWPENLPPEPGDL